MGTIYKNGVPYSGGSGGGPEKELTYAEYKALSEEEKSNGTTYYIKDGELPGGGGSSVEVDTTLSVEGAAADAKAVGDALNNLKLSDNILDCSGLTEQTIEGVTFTPVYDDNGQLEYINANGTATASANIEISKHLSIDSLADNADYVLTGGTTNAKIFLNLRNSDDVYIKTLVQESGAGFVFNKEMLLAVEGCAMYNIGIYVPNGSTHTNTSIKPEMKLIGLDNTLSVKGAAADAKAVGDALKAIDAKMATFTLSDDGTTLYITTK